MGDIITKNINEMNTPTNNNNNNKKKKKKEIINSSIRRNKSRYCKTHHVFCAPPPPTPPTPPTPPPPLPPTSSPPSPSPPSPTSSKLSLSLPPPVYKTKNGSRMNIIIKV